MSLTDITPILVFLGVLFAPWTQASLRLVVLVAAIGFSLAAWWAIITVGLILWDLGAFYVQQY